MVDAAHAVNPHCEVLTTRKSQPGAKDLFTLAVMAGGAFPHRLGLSETVLVFDHHFTFCGGFDAFVENLPAIKARCIEKKLIVEADPERARILARAGEMCIRDSSQRAGVAGIPAGSRMVNGSPRERGKEAALRRPSIWTVSLR